ncbi:MAG: TaqI-like C-terminal specificity domain-containing protein [Chitinophagales bacterium]|nr:TaqI-like C-terminal specificity domain-containing protein [Chitinophagales bacterium]
MPFNIQPSISWVILTPIEQRIKEKIERIGVPLKDWDIAINYGIKTGYNEAFIIDGKKRAELIAEDPKSDEIIRPILRGRDIKRYDYEFADLWLIYIPWHFPLHKDPRIVGASVTAEKAFKECYPAIYNHLNQYKDKLLERNKAETGLRYEWYALQRWGANYWEDFIRPKIVWKRVGSIIRFTYDETGKFALDSTCFATGADVKPLSAILNSKTGKYLLKDSPKTGTGDLLISVQAVEPLKLPVLDNRDKLIFEKFVDQILERIMLNMDWTDIEAEIDKHVYKLFEFSQEEIAFIEAQ